MVLPRFLPLGRPMSREVVDEKRVYHPVHCGIRRYDRDYFPGLPAVRGEFPLAPPMATQRGYRSPLMN